MKDIPDKFTVIITDWQTNKLYKNSMKPLEEKWIIWGKKQSTRNTTKQFNSYWWLQGQKVIEKGTK